MLRLIQIRAIAEHTKLNGMKNEWKKFQRGYKMDKNAQEIWHLRLLWMANESGYAYLMYNFKFGKHHKMT